MDERGNIVDWLGAASDITERKRAEEVLRASEEELREADRRKDEFLAMLAHDSATRWPRFERAWS